MLQRKGDLVAEYAGLWAFPEYRGLGLSGAMMSTAVAMSALRGVNVGLGFTHHHLVFWTPIGFQKDDDLGFFAYPDPRYHSYILWIDPQTLQAASPEYRLVMFAMREALRSDRRIFWTPNHGDSLVQQVFIQGAQTDAMAAAL